MDLGAGLLLVFSGFCACANLRPLVVWRGLTDCTRSRRGRWHQNDLKSARGSTVAGWGCIMTRRYPMGTADRLCRAARRDQTGCTSVAGPDQAEAAGADWIFCRQARGSEAAARQVATGDGAVPLAVGRWSRR